MTINLFPGTILQSSESFDRAPDPSKPPAREERIRFGQCSCLRNETFGRRPYKYANLFWYRMAGILRSLTKLITMLINWLKVLVFFPMNMHANRRVVIDELLPVCSAARPPISNLFRHADFWNVQINSPVNYYQMLGENGQINCKRFESAAANRHSLLRDQLLPIIRSRNVARIIGW